MRFTYCPHCGCKLTEKEIGDEGMIPFCESCNIPLFDMFSSCIIALAVNEKNEAALLEQRYMSTQYYNLISGYMKPGETAEEAARREIFEEIGIKADNLEFAGTYWFSKKDMLMIGFTASVKKKKMKLSKEVDSAVWADVSKAINMVHPKGSVSYALLDRYIKSNEKFSG